MTEDNVGWKVFGVIMLGILIFVIGMAVGIDLQQKEMIRITEQYYGNATIEYFMELIR